ncbi:MAG TPA: LacI family DNA-binding transcriptional regulator [Synergistales bacterium]|jgi:LacI family transcriptional regulator|nr:LacI family DNA-binding transcriptional regulator [Synergistales bacterium]MDI9392416.1 LacI family DNA-binding transcriptional regulator [Synergistota bacterium]NLV65280.1 LacI family transcriptional regulator [Synergistaceae bacterium]HRW87201.1 LacI family DNA-binding transcriptional regulator [Thermovirgaceae bacterium]MDD3830676.1 LacI family DNA-binding transcriptional regulator [Synergistales bacterium]
MRVTMSDVAKAAGVNKATVSRVLRGDSRISPSTSEKVWAAVKELGYRPDAIARGLSSSSSDTVGVFLRDISSPWAGEYLAGLERVLSRHGIEFILRATGGDPQQRRNAMYRLLSRRVDGFVWLDGEPEPDAGIPSITVGRTRAGGASVSVDIGSAASQLTRLAEGRKIEVFQGENPLFPGIQVLLPGDTERGGGTVRIFDGLLPPRNGSSSEGIAVVCATRRCPVVPSGAWKLYWPAFELGTLSARLLLNTIQAKGVRPGAVSVLPVLSGPF